MTVAHTLGEFGVVLMVGGSIPGETKTRRDLDLRPRAGVRPGGRRIDVGDPARGLARHPAGDGVADASPAVGAQAVKRRVASC